MVSACNRPEAFNPGKNKLFAVNLEFTLAGGTHIFIWVEIREGPNRRYHRHCVPLVLFGCPPLPPMFVLGI